MTHGASRNRRCLYVGGVCVVIAAGIVGPMIGYATGCSTDWTLVGGIIVSALGTLALAVIDGPPRRKQLYLHKLQATRNRLLRQQADTDDSPFDTQTLLNSVIPKIMTYDENEVNTPHIKVGADVAKLFDGSGAASPEYDESIAKLSRKLKSDIIEERVHLRRISLLIIAAGFVIQALATGYDGGGLNFLLTQCPG